MGTDPHHASAGLATLRSDRLITAVGFVAIIVSSFLAERALSPRVDAALAGALGAAGGAGLVAAVRGVLRREGAAAIAAKAAGIAMMFFLVFWGARRAGL